MLKSDLFYSTIVVKIENAAQVESILFSLVQQLSHEYVDVQISTVHMSGQTNQIYSTTKAGFNRPLLRNATTDCNNTNTNLSQSILPSKQNISEIALARANQMSVLKQKNILNRLQKTDRRICANKTMRVYRNHKRPRDVDAEERQAQIHDFATQVQQIENKLLADVSQPVELVEFLGCCEIHVRIRGNVTPIELPKYNALELQVLFGKCNCFKYSDVHGNTKLLFVDNNGAQTKEEQFLETLGEIEKVLPFITGTKLAHMYNRFVATNVWLFI